MLDSSAILIETSSAVLMRCGAFTLSPSIRRTRIPMDEFHDLRSCRVARPALTVRAPTGYYNEPVYFDNPRPGIEKVTVAQLEELVHAHTTSSACWRISNSPNG